MSLTFRRLIYVAVALAAAVGLALFSGVETAHQGSATRMETAAGSGEQFAAATKPGSERIAGIFNYLQKALASSDPQGILAWHASLLGQPRDEWSGQAESLIRGYLPTEFQPDSAVQGVVCHATGCEIVAVYSTRPGENSPEIADQAYGGWVSFLGDLNAEPQWRPMGLAPPTPLSVKTPQNGLVLIAHVDRLR